MSQWSYVWHIFASIKQKLNNGKQSRQERYKRSTDRFLSQNLLSSSLFLHTIPHSSLQSLYVQKYNWAWTRPQTTCAVLLTACGRTCCSWTLKSKWGSQVRIMPSFHERCGWHFHSHSESDQCHAGFYSQADRKELLVIFQSVLFLIRNLWPCRYQEMGLQNYYFISHTMQRKRLIELSWFLQFSVTDCFRRYAEDWALFQVTFSLFLLGFSQYFIVASGFSAVLHLFLLLPFC